MLSMKTLRVAVVAMGSALLLGPGLAVAIDLDGSGASAPVPRMIATQTIPSGAGNMTQVAGGSAMYHNITIDEADYFWEITPNVRLVEGYFLRVALGDGMIFRGTLAARADESAIADTNRVAGGAGYNYVVYELPAVALSTDPAAPNKIDLAVQASLAVANANVADYTASMTIHEKQFDAIDGVAAFRSLGATDITVVRAVSGVDARITPTNHVADVGTGFRWFVGPDAATPNVSGVQFGTANAMAKSGTAAVRDAGAGADTATAAGAEATSADMINATGVTLGVEGDFSVGVFDLIPTMIDDPDNPGTMIDNACPNRVGSAGSPTMADAGNLKPDEDDAAMRMLAGQAPGTYKLCMEVDLAGPMSNTSPIPATDYMVTVYTRTNTDPRDNMMASEGSIGKITRNGASVTVSYLTTSEKHNQRLIIVNRGSRPVSILDIDFHSEDGTEANLSAAALAAAGTDAAMIMPGEAVMHRVRDMLSITGNSARTAATLSFNAVAGQLDVATTQVNLSDGSTDTVMWPVK